MSVAGPDPKREAAESTHVESRPQMNIVIVGHVDHGKSTLVGRLLADTGSLPQGKLDKVKRECARTGKPFEYAFLLDALEDEQDQGITIDTARCFFKTAARDYIIIDAPGHIEFLKNMISGAARAEAALLMIDAKEGVRENSRRHGWILGMLGIRQVVVCVNKMDLVGYSQAAFDAIEKEYRAFLTGIGAVSPKAFVPIAAITGENLTQRSQAMGWYRGDTVLDMLDGFAKQPPKIALPLRMPVQAIYKFTEHGDDRRVIAGRIETGKVQVGDEVVFSPSNKSATIRSIEGFNAAPRASIEAGWSTGFTLSEEIYVTRGEVMSHKAHAPMVGTRFRANLIWLGRTPMTQGRDYKLKLHTSAIPVRIRKLNKVLDASRLDGELAKDHVGRHDVADVVLETAKPIAFDLSRENDGTGRFVIVDGYDVAGGGIIVESVTDEQDTLRSEARMRDFSWIPGGVTAAERAQRNGHRAALVMFLGKPQVGKHRYARALEKALFDDGKNPYLLDGTNVLLGVDHDLSAEATQDELVRRFGEVAYLILNAGAIVVSTTNAIGMADYGAVQALIGGNPSIAVEVDPTGRSTAACDLRIKGTESEAEVIAKVVTLLKQRQVFSA
ncbi:MAG TPA: GTP-binding protein [Planctomycetota bacterium]|nr:GTP-binding protein [Planctomycetota bacterium]